MNNEDWKALAKACAAWVLVVGVAAAIFFGGAYWHGWRPLA